ncbi:hypothetical protein [Amycolatopsis sp. NPDC051903]|uniref:hypothetical protein n=1 Tax=Amycolatopsis sp. NPDC051903 TaxID=3363936 RepID=UPI0037A53102
MEAGGVVAEAFLLGLRGHLEGLADLSPGGATEPGGHNGLLEQAPGAGDEAGEVGQLRGERDPRSARLGRFGLANGRRRAFRLCCSRQRQRSQGRAGVEHAKAGWIIRSRWLVPSCDHVAYPSQDRAYGDEDGKILGCVAPVRADDEQDPQHERDERLDCG